MFKYLAWFVSYNLVQLSFLICRLGNTGEMTIFVCKMLEISRRLNVKYNLGHWEETEEGLVCTL
jgi:hypothetical protein